MLGILPAWTLCKHLTIVIIFTYFVYFVNVGLFYLTTGIELGAYLTIFCAMLPYRQRAFPRAQPPQPIDNAILWPAFPNPGGNQDGRY